MTSYRIRLLATGSAVVCLAGAAQAQDAPAAAADTQITDIVVTAQKRSENLQDVPIAITAIGADKLAASGISDTQGLANIVPGLTMNTAGGGQIVPRIRGVGQTAVTITLENPVAIYVDGVYLASPAAGIFSLNNIDQISVLKGPQGTLFGRNATGGLIQVTTRDPSSTFQGNADVTAGNLDTYGANLYLTGPLAENLAADIAVHYLDQGDGFGRNEFTGRDVNRSKEFNIRSKLRFEPTDRTTVTLAGDYSRYRSALPAFRVDRSARIAAPNLPYPSFVGKFDIYSDLEPRSDIDQGGGSLTIAQDLDFAKLTAITAYRVTDLDLVLESDYGPLRVADVRAGQHERTFTQEVQLVSTGKGPFQWTVGAFYFNNRGFYDPPVAIYNGGGFLQIGISSRPKVYSSAGYAQGTYAITDRLNATAGIRYSHEKREIAGTSTLTFPTSTIVTNDSASLTDDRPTWRLSLDYRFSPEVLGYASYNRGFKSGGFSPTEVPYVQFKPEIVDAYESGLKLDLLDRRLRINPSAYYYKYSNLQVAIFESGLQRTRNAAKATIYGMDMDLIARVSSQFTLTSGIAWTHARYDEFNGAPIYTPRASGGNIVTAGSAAGNRVVNTPDWTIDVGATYTIPLGTNDLVLSATYFHSDGWFAEAENRYRQRPYNLVNVSATLDIRKDYTLSAWGRNLGNVAYARQRSSTDGGDIVAMAAGRTFGATLGVKF